MSKIKCGKGCFGVIVVIITLACCCDDTSFRLVGDFDSQVQQLMTYEMMTEAEFARLRTVFYDLHETFQRQWPGSKVIPVGSTVTGLTTKASDADCLILLPHYDTYNVSINRFLIQQAAILLNQQPELYQGIRPKYRAKNKIDVLKFTYAPTQRNCDVNFINKNALYISTIMHHYYTVDNRAFNVSAIIKFWTKIHQRNENTTISSYTMSLLVVFYLQQENILPPFYLLQKTEDGEYSLDNFKMSRYNTMNVYELLGGFFEYYSEFDFDNYVISPVLGRPIHKKEFEDFETLPEELNSYKVHMRDPRNQGINLNNPLCVQDLLPLYDNSAANSILIDVLLLKSHVKYAAKAFRALPKDEFLSAILIREYDANILPVNRSCIHIV